MGLSPSRPAPVLTVSEDEKLAHSVESLSIASPTSPSGTLTSTNISNWEKGVASDPKAQLARTVLSRANLDDSLIRREALVADIHVSTSQQHRDLGN